MLFSEGDNGHCPDQDRIISILIVWEKLKLHHFCILLKVCNILKHFDDDTLLVLSKLNRYPGNSIVSVQCLFSGHTHINGKYLFENIVLCTATKLYSITRGRHHSASSSSATGVSGHFTFTAATLKICHILLIFGTIFGHSLSHFKNKFQSGQ